MRYDSDEREIMDLSLRSLIKLYINRASEIESYLFKRPRDWGKFQFEFNTKMDDIFRNIMIFEKINLCKGNENKVYKLKQLFIRRFKKLFSRGVYCDWTIRKPFGYAGDFKIIEDIYENNPTTVGMDRLFDNYFQMSAISVAVRNRKEDFKRIIMNFIHNKPSSQIRIMNLACGSCRELREICFSDSHLLKNIVFDCYDNDERALKYTKELLGKHSNFNFYQVNAVRIALKKDITMEVDKKYDLIFSTGLFDYFTERISVMLIRNLKKLLNPNGVMIISSVRDKYTNPSVHFMEWAGDWNLVYRDDDSFKQIFLEAGFEKNNLETQYEQQGIMQYIIAINNRGKTL